jgi:hypothetical protein
MNERLHRRSRLALAIPVMCAMLVAGGLWAAQENGQQSAEKATATKKFRGRLPAYFAAIVSTEQRQKVYDLQAAYAEKIAALEEQIAQLVGQRDKDVDAVLTPEQSAEVSRKRAEAAAKRKARQGQSTAAAKSEG